MDSKEQIKTDNERVIRMMRSGQSLAMIPPEKTWFPPRPKIEKDPNALEIGRRDRKSLRIVD